MEVQGPALRGTLTERSEAEHALWKSDSLQPQNAEGWNPSLIEDADINRARILPIVSITELFIYLEIVKQLWYLNFANLRSTLPLDNSQKVSLCWAWMLVSWSNSEVLVHGFLGGEMGQPRDVWILSPSTRLQGVLNQSSVAMLSVVTSTYLLKVWAKGLVNMENQCSASWGVSLQ